MPRLKKEQKENLKIRPPVVVVLGHVDHGKSSILEAIKDLKITAKESGGITQHIGAYEIEQGSKKITFIDTPGHEAFSAMRSRGAKVADIAILVVAGEEGVKPQTEEAILHIKKAEIPMIVAINKMDKTEADSEKVKRELVKKDVLVESMGGKVPSVNVSAKTGKGIPELLEIILLLAEMENLKGDISKSAQGVVIESYLDANRGPTATLLLRDGILKRGDILGTPSTFGKIKIMENFKGDFLGEAFPSMPIIVIGFEKVPGVGERFTIFSNIEAAKKGIEGFQKQTPEVLDIEPGQRVVNLILKVDVVGSLEAIEEILKELPHAVGKASGDAQQEKPSAEAELGAEPVLNRPAEDGTSSGVILRILKAEAGDIKESDVKLAIGAKAKIVGFRVKINPVAKKLAEREKITVMSFEIIYELAQAVRNLLEKRVIFETVRVDLGKIKVLSIFRTEKSRQIVGGKVIEGEVKQGALLEIYREEKKVGKGKIIELQRDKKKIKEITKGSECGVLYGGEKKIEEGDILEIYIEERKKGEL